MRNRLTTFSRIFEFGAVQKCGSIGFLYLQKCVNGRWSHHVDEKHHANKSQDQVDDGNVEAENRPAPKKRAEPKKATKKVAMKEPKKKAKPGGKQRTTGS